MARSATTPPGAASPTVDAASVGPAEPARGGVFARRIERLTGHRAASPWWRDRLRRRLLATADLGTGLSFALMLWLLADDAGPAVWSLISLPVWILLAKLNGLYDRDHRVLRHLTVDELPELLSWALTSVVATGLVLVATPPGMPRMRAVVGAFMAAFALSMLLRAGARWCWRRLTPPERTLIVGLGPLADEARRKLELFPDIHAVFAGEVDALGSELTRDRSTWLENVDRIIVAGFPLEETLIGELIAQCREHKTKLSVVPPVQGRFGTAVKLSHVADLPLVEYNTWDVSRSTILLKRIIDVTASTVLLALLAPICAGIAIAIVLDSRGPVLFVQRRAGLAGTPFGMLKFRTMVPDAERRLQQLVQIDGLMVPMFKLRDDPRVTRIGRVLRRLSLDEIPQLLNVLRGEMSLVGPRPEQVELVERYGTEHGFKLLVKPGMTGPMQVFGRGDLTFEERLSVERDYIENLSLARDLRIIALTFAATLGGGGAY